MCPTLEQYRDLNGFATIFSVAIKYLELIL